MPVCGDHGLLLQRLEHLAAILEAYTTTSGRLLDRLDTLATENSRTAAVMEHFKEELTELKADLKDVEAEMKAGDGNQWTAINELRSKASTGRGIAITVSVVISAVVAIAAAYFGK